MSHVGVVTDSTADVPEDVASELGIVQVPVHVHFGDVTYRDRIDITSDQFYEKLAQSERLPTTSQPSIGAFSQAYHELAEQTDEIISIHLTKALSGTYNSAHTAARSVAGARIELVNSRTTSLALGMLVIIAAQAAREGKNLDEILTLVRERVPRARLVAMLDTLEYVEKGGRIGKARALMGSLLNVKPLIQVADDEIQPLENVRSRKRAMRRMAEIAETMAPFEELGIAYTHTPEWVPDLRERLAAFHPEERILVTEAGPVLGVHAGPGAIGFGGIFAKGS